MVETVAFREPGDCAILVQNLRLQHVGNRFACSIHYGFLRTIRSGYRNKCISISVKALLKSAPAQLFSAAFHAFCGSVTLAQDADASEQTAKNQTFRTVKGLKTSRGTSFESVAYPGKYLVLKDGMLKLGTKEDKEEATFYIDKK